MTDTFEFTLDNPLTEEQLGMITDVDFDRTDRITFHTKHGKEVEFAKVIRCKDCKYWQFFDQVKANVCKRRYNGHWWTSHEDDFCSRAERKEE